MAELTVSVLIPTFNRAELLVECLDSVLAQTRRPDEIIVVNDGCTDDTMDRLRPYLSDIRVLSQKNAGKSAALNKALGAATGDLIWVMDDDDLAAPDALDVLLSLLRKHPEAGFAYGRHDRFEVQPNGQTRWRSTGYWRTCAPGDFLFETLLDMFVHQPGLLVRRELYRRAGAFNETLIRSQDYDMLLRLAQLARPAGTDRIVFHQRQHDLPRGTASRPISCDDRARAWQQYDRIIFKQLATTLPLGKYLPAGSDLTRPGAIRRALIRRAIVMARKGLWAHAAEDFQRAARLNSWPLTDEEIADLRKLFMSKFTCDDGLLVPRIRETFTEIKKTSRTGAQISRAAARALAWRIRLALQKRNPFLAFRLASLVIGLNIPTTHEPIGIPPSLARR